MKEIMMVEEIAKLKRFFQKESAKMDKLLPRPWKKRGNISPKLEMRENP